MSWTIDQMFNLVVERHASDIVLVPGTPPALWVSGRMTMLDAEPLRPDDVAQAFLPTLKDSQRATLEAMGDVDYSLGRENVGRLRINLHRQRGSIGAAIRFIPHEIPTFENLSLPSRVLDLADLPRGLVLVTGGAGSGKSTTLAAMIDYINHNHDYHVITLEDPVEFTFRHARSVIEQREVGPDCPSFVSALRHVVRQRPDAILVGEMRDLETISAALTAAETGHLVMASLHTVSAVETISRIIDVFPAGQQAQVRVQLADTLRGVVCQTLFPDQLSEGMVPAAEILIATPGIRRAIRENETHLIGGMIEMGMAQGMRTMDSAIAELVAAGRIPRTLALTRAQNPDRLAKVLAA